MRVIVFLVILLVTALVFHRPILEYSTQDVVTVTVKKVERECSGVFTNGDCKYMVYTSDEVFKNVDSIWFLKFHSSDVNNQLLSLVDKEATLNVNMFRFPIFSMYRNIISVESK